MKYLNHKRIKILCALLFLFNIIFWTAQYIQGSLTYQGIFMAVIYFFLVFLFYFFATTYFVYVNDQMVNFRNDLNKHEKLRIHGAKKINETISYLSSIIKLQEQLKSNDILLSKKVDEIESGLNIKFNQFRESLRQSIITKDFLVAELNKIPKAEFVKNQFDNLPNTTFVKNQFDKLPKTEFVKNQFDNLPNTTFVKNQFDKLPRTEFVKNQFGNLPNTAFIKNQFDKLPKTEFVKNLNAHLGYQLNDQYNRIDALFSIHNILNLGYPLPIMSDWAISSDFAHILMSTILNIENPTIVDVGSGISTIISGYLAKDFGGHVISLEHDKEYYEKSKTMIDNHGLGKFVNLYYCPLKEYTINKKEWQWYDISKIDLPESVDLVTVDGPPGIIQPNSRYPAIPILNKHLSEDVTILLDDGLREDEQEIAQMWVDEYNFKSELIKSHKGIIILHWNDQVNK